MMKTLKVKSTDDGDAFLDLADFSDIVDISKVEFYTLEEIEEDGQSVLLLKFYDKDENVVETKHETK